MLAGGSIRHIPADAPARGEERPRSTRNPPPAWLLVPRAHNFGHALADAPASAQPRATQPTALHQTAPCAASYTGKVNIRSIIAPTLSRYPTEYQWEELEELLRRAISQMPRQTLPEALADEPARSVIDEWRHRHWLDESAAFLP